MRDDGSESNLFREAHFSKDGTTLITQNEDQSLRTFVLPSDLLDEAAQPHAMTAYSTGPSPTNMLSYAIYPGFDLSNTSSTLVLSAAAEQPITLRNALDYDTVHAKYFHVNSLTEAYERVNSLAFSRDGSYFIAGGKDRIATFDCSRNASGPTTNFRTAVSKKARKQYGAPRGVGCAGIVNALAISADGMLAAGTTEREIALYDNEGRGECITAFSVAQLPGGYDSDYVKGTGITSLQWSPCGTYLVIAERQSDSMQVYDVRNTLQWVSHLTGRKAETNQKLGIDMVPTADGYEVWAGGTDGCVRMWNNPGHQYGEHTLDMEMKLHDGKLSRLETYSTVMLTQDDRSCLERSVASWRRCACHLLWPTIRDFRVHR